MINGGKSTNEADGNWGKLSGETGVTLRCEWGYETSYIPLLQAVLAVNAAGKIWGPAGENGMCRAVGENVLSHGCGWQSQHSGNEHEYIRVSQSTLGFSPATLLGVNRKMGQCVYCGLAHWHGGSQEGDGSLSVREGNNGWEEFMNRWNYAGFTAYWTWWTESTDGHGKGRGTW